MAKLTLKKGSTDVTVYLFAQDSSKTTGEGLTGLAYNTASLTAYYVRPLGSATAITLATQTVTGAHSDGGFKEVDATNMPGVYRLDLPDAVCATGVPSVVVMLKGAANLAPVLLEIQLTDFDLNTAGVLIGATQGAITWGQQKIIANVAGEGALDIENTSTGGLGGVGIRAEGEFAGQYNAGSQTRTSAGQFNTGIIGVWNRGDSIGQLNEGSYKAVDGFDSALAHEATLTAIKGDGWSTETLAAIHSLANTTFGYSEDIKAKTDNLPASPADEATLTAIKGSGWTNQTLVKIVTDISNISAGSGATPQQIWEYATRELTAGTNITIPTAADVADAVWDEAISEHTTATTFGGKNQKVVPSETVGDYKADVSSLATAASLTTVDNKVGTIDGIVDAIKLKTDTIPASPAEAGEYTAAIAAVKSVADDILVDTSTTLDGKLNTIDTNVDSILADTGTDGVKIASGELSTVATASSITALDGKIDTIDNFLDTEVAAILADTNELQAELADGGRTDLLIDAIKAKTDVIPASPAPANEYDARMTAIQAELDNPDQYKADVSGIPAAVWGYATRTLSSFGTLVADIWGYVTRTLTAFGFTVATNSDANVIAIKGKTDNLPANTATALSTIQADLDNPNQYKADVSGLATQVTANAIKAKTDNLPLSPAPAGEYTAAIAAIPTTPLLAADYTAPDNAGIAAIKTKTNNLPLSPAAAGEYTAALSTIQADLDNPDQYKADVSGLALTTHVQEVEDKIDAIDTQSVMDFVIDGFTFEQIVQIMAASLAGKLTRTGDTLRFRDLADTVDRIIAETDTNKQRTNMTFTV